MNKSTWQLRGKLQEHKVPCTPFHDKYVYLDQPLPASNPPWKISNTSVTYFYLVRLVLDLIELGAVADLLFLLISFGSCMKYFYLIAAAWTTDLRFMTINAF